ncbi:MAG: Integrase family protein [Pedosphaera sp.]|nr:Integrase family protein [Pedosphaera sp.]
MSQQDRTVNLTIAFILDTHLDKIHPVLIHIFVAKRQKQDLSAHIVNLEVTILRNVLNRAIDEKCFIHLPHPKPISTLYP